MCYDARSRERKNRGEYLLAARLLLPLWTRTVSTATHDWSVAAVWQRRWLVCYITVVLGWLFMDDDPQGTAVVDVTDALCCGRDDFCRLFMFLPCNISSSHQHTG